MNNYHARMLASALRAARSDELEYVQLVSFGCGHDAYLSDEIARLMREASGKVPLVLKVDETDAQGPLRIRLRSFLETVDRKRSRAAGGARAAGKGAVAGGKGAAAGKDAAPAAGDSGMAAASAAAAPAASTPAPRGLPDPYPVKFERSDRARRVVLVPTCRGRSAAS